MPTHIYWGTWGRASNWATSLGSWTNYIVRINVAPAMHGLWYLTAAAKKRIPPVFPSCFFSSLQYAWVFLNGGEFKNRFMGQLNIVGKTDSLTSLPSFVTPSFHPSPISQPSFHPPVFVSVSLPLVFYKMIYLLKRDGTVPPVERSNTNWQSRPYGLIDTPNPYSFVSFFPFSFFFCFPLSHPTSSRLPSHHLLTS